MTIIVATKTRWHHPLTIAKNRVKKYLAFFGFVALIAGGAYLAGHGMH